MRKEIGGLFLVFLLVFVLISLLSYHPGDPSIHHAAPATGVHNVFGVLGAHLAGLLIGLFGIGAFWIPFFMLFWSFELFGKRDSKALPRSLAGAMLLLIATSALAAFNGNHVEIFGRQFTSGGVVGIPVNSLLVKYANAIGAFLILSLFSLIGLIMGLRFSIAQFALKLWKTIRFLKWRERGKKVRKRQKALRKKPVKPRKKITIAPTPKTVRENAPAPKQQEFEFMKSDGDFQKPSVDFLDDPEPKPDSINASNLRMMSKLLEKKLEDFGVNGSVVTVMPGPVITTFEYEPAPGVKINKIVNLSDDLALALRATSIRIVAPIPGKAVIGIEVPNLDRELVCFKDVITSDAFEKSKSMLTMCLGKDIEGNPVATQLDKMPHLLIAGATGTGKSVGLNTMLCSLLYKSSPDDVKLIMIDPKRIELTMYDGIPHLITPVVTDVKKATNALFWAVREMERRYKLLSTLKVRNINQYNNKIRKIEPKEGEEPPEKLPYVVIIIDELADLMIVASRDVEVSLMRLAQMARAAGIHLILATQRPSVDVLTGIIKANFPTRLSFQVSSRTDSRTIIDSNGAESLLGNGDMLFLPPGTSKLQRVHGAYISEAEIVRITEFLKQQKPPEYHEEVTEAPVKEMDSGEPEEYDEKYDDAVALVTRTRQASISMVQRHLRIGYNRAARIIETMEREGVVGPSDGVKTREVLVKSHDEIP
jgi:DNA segregation ATPase FtsK/SpoIIIE, S-DNA-T family